MLPKIPTLLFLFICSILFFLQPLQKAQAFSSVLGESFIFPNGHLFPNGQIFPNGHIFPNGQLFPNGIFQNDQLFPNGDVFINGNSITTPFKKITVKNHKIFLSGYAYPYVRVKLLLHSKPMHVETTTDSNGYWTYEIPNLESGDHTLTMAVEDQNGVKTKSVLAASFTVSNQQGIGSVNHFPPLNQLNYLTISMMVLGTMGLFLCMYSYIRVRVLHE